MGEEEIEEILLFYSMVFITYEEKQKKSAKRTTGVRDVFNEKKTKRNIYQLIKETKRNIYQPIKETKRNIYQPIKLKNMKSI